jgi:hypothetical protein
MTDTRFDKLSATLAGTTSRRQALRLLGGGIAAGALGTVGLSQIATAQTASPLAGIPIVGTVGGQALDGVLNITRFVNVGGTLTAIGSFVGAVAGVAANQDFTSTVTPSTYSCEILNLVLGPINLELLGLVVTTNQIVVNITAESGPGKLLGNLLCAVTNLLNGGGPLGALSGLLNNILRVLG